MLTAVGERDPVDEDAQVTLPGSISAAITSGVEFVVRDVVVGEGVVAGTVHLAHRALETALGAFEEQAELAIAIRLAGVRSRVLLAQQLQRDAFALQLLMQMRKIDGAVPIEAGASLVLKPGGAHLMLFGLEDALKAGEREGGGQRAPLRSLLLVSQAALSVVLLVGAALFVRSLQNLKTTDTGVALDNLVTFQLSPASLKVMDTCAASSSLDGPTAVSEYSRAVPSCMFAPTSQMSSSVGGFRKDGPGPENPPPAAMMPTLTLMPTTANTAVMITTCRFGDTALIGRQWLYIDYFSVTSGVTYSPIWLYIFRNLLPLSVVL